MSTHVDSTLHLPRPLNRSETDTAGGEKSHGGDGHYGGREPPDVAGASFGFVTHLFEPVSALPEEQVGRDSRAQHRDQQLQVGLVQLDMGDDEVVNDAAPLKLGRR